ncbi:NUDIX hydrolase [Halomonas sp. H5]|uniref:NUDIX hydrolase n=1 Tax=Halomonas sp. H5 TaxID=3423910 RepID=UPI003D365DEE
MSSAPPTLYVAAAVIHDGRGRLLLVRKRDTRAFMQAGGKIEPGETPEAALRRELGEELGCLPRRLRYLGEYLAPAANEPGHRLHAHLFQVELDAAPQPGAEIDTLCWVTPAQAQRLALAPLTRDRVLPLMERLEIDAAV